MTWCQGEGGLSTALSRAPKLKSKDNFRYCGLTAVWRSYNTATLQWPWRLNIVLKYSTKSHHSERIKCERIGIRPTELDNINQRQKKNNHYKKVHQRVLNLLNSPSWASWASWYKTQLQLSSSYLLIHVLQICWPEPAELAWIRISFFWRALSSAQLT